MLITTTVVVVTCCSGNVMAEDREGVTKFNFYYDMIISNLILPVKNLQREIKDLKSNNTSKVFFDLVEKQEASDEFKWVFNTRGVIPISPVLDEKGTIYTSTVNIEIDFDLQELINNGSNMSIVNINSLLYSLEPEPAKMGGKQNWLFRNISGAVIFPPAISTDGSIVVGSVDGIDEVLDNLNSRLVTVDVAGEKKWENVNTFEDEVFLSPPVIVENGTIVVVSANILKFLATNNLDDIDTRITVLNSNDGSVLWTLEPKDLNIDESLIITTPPSVSKSGDTLMFGVINSAGLSIGEELALFISEFEDSINIDEEKNGELTEAVKNGEDIKPILDGIESEIELQLNAALDEFIDESFVQLCLIIALDVNDGSLKWQSTLPGLCLVPPIQDPNNDNILYSSRPNFHIDIDLDVNVNVKIVDPKDPDGELEISVEVVQPDSDDFTINQIGAISAIDISSGEILWDSSIDKPIFLDPIFDENNNRVIVAGTSGFNVSVALDDINLENQESKIYAVNSTDGSIDWISGGVNGVIGYSTIDNFVSFPLLVGGDGSLFFTVSDISSSETGEAFSLLNVQAVDSQGVIKWDSPFIPKGQLTVPPVIDKERDKIFVSVENFSKFKNFASNLASTLIAIDMESGEEFRTFEMDGIASSSLVIDSERNTIYTTTSDVGVEVNPISIEFMGFVHALDLNLK